MRFLLYNIRYGTGGKWIWSPLAGYFRRTHANMQSIIAFLREMNPDIVGLVEVDAGSFRSARQNQAELIAEALGHYHSYRSKYGVGHFAHRVPLMNKQGNAFVSRNTIAGELFHYFEKGVKRLVIELDLADITIFLVHLALSARIRHDQLSELYELVRDTKKPHIVAGDFNATWGDREIRLFLAATGLVNADPSGARTFPSWDPKRQLDFILHSPQIRASRFWIPQVTFSDHLPLVLDFELG